MTMNGNIREEPQFDPTGKIEAVTWTPQCAPFAKGAKLDVPALMRAAQQICRMANTDSALRPAADLLRGPLGKHAPQTGASEVSDAIQ